MDTDTVLRSAQTYLIRQGVKNTTKPIRLLKAYLKREVPREIALARLQALEEQGLKPKQASALAHTLLALSAGVEHI